MSCCFSPLSSGGVSQPAERPETREKVRLKGRPPEAQRKASGAGIGSLHDKTVVGPRLGAGGVNGCTARISGLLKAERS